MVLIRRGEMEANFTMEEAIESMAEAFSGLSSGESSVPERYVVDSTDGALTMLLKPAFTPDKQTSGVKILSLRNLDPLPGIPRITGIVLLMDNESGEVLSLLDGEFMTALRTGAASGLATRLLSREDSRTLAIFGCGRQGRTQLEAVHAVREIERTWVFDTSRESAESFVQEMKDQARGVLEIAGDLSVLKEADIICTATNSEEPLFGRAHCKEGTHINAIGSFKPQMQELEPDLIHSSRIYLDDRKACLHESGDLIKAKNKYNSLEYKVIGEIGELVTGKIRGRVSQGDITLFKSVGTAIQDMVVADRIYQKSRTIGFGEEIRLYE